MAICFVDKDEARTCIGNFWYFSMLEEGHWHSWPPMPDLATTYVGSTEKLREHITAILAGRDVVISVARLDSADLDRREIGPAYRDWAHGKKGRACRIKAGLKIDREIFVAWGVDGADLVPSLMAGLRHTDSSVRAEAADDLGQLGPIAQDAIPSLQATLKDPDGYVRVNAAEALARIDGKDRGALPTLIAALQAQDAGVRGAAAHAMGALGAPAQACIPDLIVRLSHEKESTVRSEIVFTLGEISPEATRPTCQPRVVVPILGRVLRQDRDRSVRLWAALALRRFGPQAQAAIPDLSVALTHEASEIAEIAADVLARIGPAAVPALAEAVGADNCAARHTVARYLGEMRAVAATAALRKGLKDPDPSLRRVVALALLGIDRKKWIKSAIPVLTEVANEEEWGLGYRVLSDLRDLGPDAAAALPMVIKFLKCERRAHSRLAMEVLAEIGPAARGASPDLKAVMETGTGEYHVAAAWALWRVQSRAEVVVPMLVKVLREGEEPACDSAALLLGDLGPKGGCAIPILMPLLQDRSVTVRRAAAMGLGSIGAEAREALPALNRLTEDKEVSVRLQAARALWRIDPRNQKTIPTLTAALKDPDRSVRLDAAGLLAGIDPDRAARIVVPVLVEALRDEDPFVRGKVAETLGALGAKARAAVPALRAALEDEPAVRVRAAAALCKVDPGHADTLEVLIRSLEIDGSAIDLLGDLGSDAKAGVPTLLRLLRRAEHDEYLRIGEILKRIDPEAAAKAGLP
jgi:HEAT repeat protein